jgi:hypothetical protein
MSDFPDLVPPFTRVATVHDNTDLFPQPTMDALDARYPSSAADITELKDDVQALEDLTETGRLSEAELSATIDAKGDAYDTAVGVADGSLNAATYATTSGHPITLFTVGSSPFTVDDGAFVHAVSGSITTGAYLGVELAREVREVTMSVRWTNVAGSGDEDAVIIVSGDRFTTAGYADAGCHFLISRTGWTYQTYEEGVGPAMKATSTYAALAYDEWHTFRVVYDGALVTLYFPNGSSYLVASDPDIVDWWGNHATVELYALAGRNPAAIREWEARTEVAIARPVDVSDFTALGRALKADKTPATVTTALSASFTTVNSMSVIIPASKKLYAVAVFNVLCDAGSLYAQFNLGGNTTSMWNQEVTRIANDGSLIATGFLDCTDFTVGTSQTLNLRLLKATGTGSFRQDSTTNNRRPTLVAFDVP